MDHDERSRLLAGDDWSSFPAEEQRAYAFARKLARAPQTISTQDIQSLKRDFGLERAVNILVYVEDVDSLVKRATADGAKLLRAVADQFYGDRVGVLEDPFGHCWSFATHIEDVSPEEMQKRAAEQHGA